MKNKNNKHHISIHQKLERLAHHRVVLTFILTFMGVGFIKYEAQLFHIVSSVYIHGVDTTTYAHHDEVTRMPVQYGSGMRSTYISGL